MYGYNCRYSYLYSSLIRFPSFRKVLVNMWQDDMNDDYLFGKTYDPEDVLASFSGPSDIYDEENIYDDAKPYEKEFGYLFEDYED